MAFYKSVTELIGRTPLLELGNFARSQALDARLLAKVEGLNPAGSVKDRAALAMLEKAQREGKLTAGFCDHRTCTSGNTGIGLASVTAAKGFQMIIVMPDTMSVERRQMMQAYGARLELTDGALGMKGAIARANELAAQLPGSFIPGQFSNEANPEIHDGTTGPEIWAGCGWPSGCVCGRNRNGGTITGVGVYLKEKNPHIRVVAVEPAASPVLSRGHGGAHKIQGIGAGFVPEVLDTKIYDEIITVDNDAAFVTGKAIARTAGLLVGISSGAAVWAACQLARRPENSGKNIVVMLPGNR